MQLAIKIFAGLIIAVIAIGMFFIQRNTTRLLASQDGLYENPLSGKIKGYKPMGKGMYDFRIEENGKDTVVTFYNFRKYMDKVAINDSIYKSAHSLEAHFYRKSAGGNYEISQVIELPQ